MVLWPKSSCGPFRLECDVLLWVRRAGWLPGLHIQHENSIRSCWNLYHCFHLVQEVWGLRCKTQKSPSEAEPAARQRMEPQAVCVTENSWEATSDGWRDALWPAVREHQVRANCGLPGTRAGQHKTSSVKV